jgi:hypothetical protein
MSWLTQFQGFLFAALAFAWTAAPLLIWVISLVGVLVSASAFHSLRFAHLAILQLNDQWASNKPADYEGPGVIGYMTLKPSQRYDKFIPWLFLPWLFVVSWITIVGIQLSQHLT